jgi:cytochrome c oxidase subunit IV
MIMSNTNEHVHEEGSKKLFLYIWFWLLALTGVEVYLAYIHLGVKLMLTLLMGLSIVKATLIISYFMHLRFERRSLVLTLMPAMVMVIVLLFLMFPDSFRLLRMRP